MNPNDNLTLQELEQLSQAYVDCRLSLLQEKELEFVLLCSELSSPLIEEARITMGLTAVMTASIPHKMHSQRRTFHRIVMYTGIAASIAIIAISAVMYMGTCHSDKGPEIYACVDSEVLSGYAAQKVVYETEKESMEMLQALIEDAKKEQRISAQYMNSIHE